MLLINVIQQLNYLPLIKLKLKYLGGVDNNVLIIVIKKVLQFFSQYLLDIYNNFVFWILLYCMLISILNCILNYLNYL